MSDIPLSDVQEIIERSLFEAIRKELVDKEYLPDVSDTGLFPNNPTGYAAWNAAIQAIITAKGFAIELFGVGNNEDKGVKKIPRIVLESGNVLPGALGGDPLRYFEDNGTYYKSLVTPPQTTDYYLNIIMVSNTIIQSRILNNIVALGMPRRGYVPFYNDPTKSFFIRYLNYFEANNEDRGLIEHIYSYEIKDAWDIDAIELTDDIPKMSEITFNINLQKYMDGSWGYDTDPLIVEN